jgi:hypothetical protein
VQQQPPGVRRKVRCAPLAGDYAAGSCCTGCRAMRGNLHLFSERCGATRGRRIAIIVAGIVVSSPPCSEIPKLVCSSRTFAAWLMHLTHLARGLTDCGKNNDAAWKLDITCSLKQSSCWYRVKLRVGPASVMNKACRKDPRSVGHVTRGRQPAALRSQHCSQRLRHRLRVWGRRMACSVRCLWMPRCSQT